MASSVSRLLLHPEENDSLLSSLLDYSSNGSNSGPAIDSEHNCRKHVQPQG